jgi:hypothetical protein
MKNGCSRFDEQSPVCSTAIREVPILNMCDQSGGLTL